MKNRNTVVGEVHVDFTAGELEEATRLVGRVAQDREARALLRDWARAGIALIAYSANASFADREQLSRLIDKARAAIRAEERASQ